MGVSLALRNTYLEEHGRKGGKAVRQRKKRRNGLSVRTPATAASEATPHVEEPIESQLRTFTVFFFSLVCLFVFFCLA